MKKISLKTWINQFKLVLVRFPFTLLFIIGLSVLCFLSIQKVKIDIRQGLWAFFILGMLLNVAVTLYLEEFKKPTVRILINILSTALLALYCFSLPVKLPEYQYYQLVALGIVFVLSAFFISFLKKNNEIPFWNFSRDCIIEMFIASVFSNVLFAGLGLAILSLDKLFHIQIEQEVYSNLAVVCYIIFTPVYFLSNIPDEIEKRKQDISFNKIIRIFGIYILLPILAAYTLILYVYLFRIIAKWELPNGWVSTLVSVLGMAGFLCMLILYPLRLTKESKLVDILSRYFPIVLFPLLVLMSVGIFRRLGDYGLTINRCYVLVLNVWLFLISFYLILSQSRYLKWIVISFAFVTFICSVGPWSVFNITHHSIELQLNNYLIRNHSLKDGKIVLGEVKVAKVDSVAQFKTAESIRYLLKTFGNDAVQKYFTISLKGKSESEILALLKMNNVPNAQEYFWLNLENKSLEIDTRLYKSFRVLILNQNEKLVYSDDQVNAEILSGYLIIKYKSGDHLPDKILLKDKIKSLIQENLKNRKNNFPKEEMILKGANFMLLIKTVSGNYRFEQDKLTVVNFEAYFFN